MTHPITLTASEYQTLCDGLNALWHEHRRAEKRERRKGDGHLAKRHCDAMHRIAVFSGDLIGRYYHGASDAQ